MDALFPAPSAPSSPVLVAAEAHIQDLRDRGLLDPAGNVLAELVLHLAANLGTTTKAYALANLSHELREALEQLPSEPESDPWTAIEELLGNNVR